MTRRGQERTAQQEQAADRDEAVERLPTDSDVAEYLRAHPDFFERRPDALRDLELHEYVFSMIYPAFQRGILDAVTLSLADMVAYRLQEIAGFYTVGDINVVLLHYCLNPRTFDALPPDAKDAVYRRLWQVLSGADRRSRYEHLGRGDRQAIVEILRDTKPELRDYFGTVTR